MSSRADLALVVPPVHGYALDSYAEWMRSWGAAPSTITKRMVVAKVIAATYPDPGAVTPADLTTMLANPTYSAWTRATYYGHMRSLFGWLTDTERIDDDPTNKVRRPKSPSPQPRPLTTQEAAAALAAATGHLRTWLLLGMFAGLRAHETAKIRGEDVTEETIFVIGKGRKAATIPTHPVVWEVAQDYPRVGPWFPGRQRNEHVSSVAVSQLITTLFRDLGIVGSYHRCRHFYGTALLRSGANLRVVQDLMRHSSLATTAAYLGVDESERQAAIRGLSGGEPGSLASQPDEGDAWRKALARMREVDA
jgi:integrase/recombinase XerD